MTKSSSIKRLKAGRIECIVTFAKEDVESAERKALETLSQNIQVAGFRKGKVPANMVREKINPEHLLEETIHELLPNAFASLTKEHDIKPIVRPRVSAESRDPLTVKITFVEKPEVTVKAKKIKVEKREKTVDEKDVEKMIDYILEKHKETQAVDRPAQEGDRITMDFHGEMDGKEVEGTRTKGHQVEIGSKTLIPGFEENLKELKKGDSKSFTVTFPEKYHAEQLQGKPVTFHVAVTEVESVKRPELTDAFVQKELRAENAAALRAQIRETMKAEEEQIERGRRERALFDAIADATNVDIAPELLDEEVKSMVEEFAKQLERQGLSLDQYLTHAKLTPETFIEDMKRQSEKRMKTRLGVESLVLSEKIEVTPEQTEAAIRGIADRAPEADRLQIFSAYAEGSNAREQLIWQQKVEELIARLLKE
ncbi:trigger factor [Candidatus Peregrinibacteria bacterium]|nr:trigger factor [Candidatus Peregrinibacteria bacterium]